MGHTLRRPLLLDLLGLLRLLTRLYRLLIYNVGLIIQEFITHLGIYVLNTYGLLFTLITFKDFNGKKKLFQKSIKNQIQSKNTYGPLFTLITFKGFNDKIKNQFHIHHKTSF